jgi:thiol-disulfide isomerase/thioredoxin
LVKVGETVPTFSLTTVDGEVFTFPPTNEVVLINFFATWCGPCQVELPHIERIWSEHKGNERFRLVVIGREETEDAVRAFRQQHGFSFPIAADPERTIFSLFADNSIPRTLVVSPAGKVVYASMGFDRSDLPELESVLQEQLSVRQ